MEKKIFFIDFDGTLMRDDKTPLRPAGLSAADGELQKNLD